MTTESEYGHRIRELERQVTVLEQQVKQALEFQTQQRDDARQDARDTRVEAARTRGALIVAMIMLALEQIVLHAVFH